MFIINSFFYRFYYLILKVQIKTVSCGTTPFCNCGAAVAVGKDVFMVNNCDKSTGWDIRFKNCEDGVLKEKVLEKGRNYKVSTA